VLREMEGVHGVKFPTPRQAGFRVLKASNIPSVLVEVGFLSNPEEESLLKRESFQERIAQALEASTARFLSQHAPLMAASTEPRPAGISKPKTHVVKTGQSLSGIAVLYQTSVAALKRANDLKDASHIRTGQRIVIP
jgi:N-acetylmuramoyl-L-alanine amidase